MIGNLPVVEVELPIEVGNHTETRRSFQPETFGLNDDSQGTMPGRRGELSPFVDVAQSFFVGPRRAGRRRQEGEFHLVGHSPSSEIGRAVIKSHLKVLRTLG